MRCGSTNKDEAPPKEKPPIAGGFSTLGPFNT